MHLNEEDLVLHHYGEMDTASEAHAAAHLASCDVCRTSYSHLQRVLAAVEAVPAPQLDESFERTVWARLQPQLEQQRDGWLSWTVFSPARLAWTAAIVVLVGTAFFAGRVSRRDPPAPAAGTAGSSQIRERVLLIDLGEHLDRSQTMLIELVSAGRDGHVDISTERARAAQLVSDNRLYRQSAAANGNAALASVLDELERVLVEVAAGPDELSAADLDAVLFKVRVVSSKVRERQKAAIRMRSGQSS